MKLLSIGTQIRVVTIAGTKGIRRTGVITDVGSFSSLIFNSPTAWRKSLYIQYTCLMKDRNYEAVYSPKWIEEDKDV